MAGSRLHSRDVAYFRERAREERSAAEACHSGRARDIHCELARAYELAACGESPRDTLHADDDEHSWLEPRTELPRPVREDSFLV